MSPGRICVIRVSSLPHRNVNAVDTSEIHLTHNYCGGQCREHGRTWSSLICGVTTRGFWWSRAGP